MAEIYCEKCGAALNDGAKSCPGCGAPMKEQREQVTSAAGYASQDSYAYEYGGPEIAPAAPPRASARTAPSFDGRPPADSPYAPITGFGFFGILLLMLVPGVNLVTLVVWACGGCRKIAKRSFARAALVVMVIVSILAVIIGFIVAAWLEVFLAETGLDMMLPLLFGS